MGNFLLQGFQGKAETKEKIIHIHQAEAEISVLNPTSGPDFHFAVVRHAIIVAHLYNHIVSYPNRKSFHDVFHAKLLRIIEKNFPTGKLLLNHLEDGLIGFRSRSFYFQPFRVGIQAELCCGKCGFIISI